VVHFSTTQAFLVAGLHQFSAMALGHPVGSFASALLKRHILASSKAPARAPGHRAGSITSTLPKGHIFSKGPSKSNSLCKGSSSLLHNNLSYFFAFYTGK